MLGDHAVHRAGAYGEATVEVHLLARWNLMLASGVAVGRWHGLEIHAPDRNVTLLGPIVSRHTVSLDDLTGSEPALLAAARPVLTEIFQAFGTAEFSTGTSGPVFDWP